MKSPKQIKVKDFLLDLAGNTPPPASADRIAKSKSVWAAHLGVDLKGKK